MDWLNYHHFLYFYVVAREGSISAASEILRLAPSTISVQIKTLEETLDQQLFERVGRNLVLTEQGRTAYSYAEEIFSLGQEMMDTFRSRPTGRPTRLNVGVADVLWKDIAYQLIEPATQLENGVRLACREGTHDELLGALALHQVDVVLADAPIGPTVSIKAFNHQLGQCGVVIMASPGFVAKHGSEFPENLASAPFLMPTEKTALRRHLDQWFESEEAKPNIVAEFDDSALMIQFGANGMGAFPVPSIVAEDVATRYDVIELGRAERVQQSFFAITVDRKIKHPGVQAICTAAKQQIFH